MMLAIPVLLIVVLLLDRLDWVLGVFVYWGIVVIYGMVLSGMACPDCGKRFFFSGFGLTQRGLWINECQHCGFPKNIHLASGDRLHNGA